MKQLCESLKTDGTPCPNVAHGDTKFCFVHDPASKKPWMYKKPIQRDKATRLLAGMGLDSRAIQKMEKEFPELRELTLHTTDPQRAMEIVAQIIAMRVAINPTADAARAFVILGEFLTKNGKKTTAITPLDLFGEDDDQ